MKQACVWKYCVSLLISTIFLNGASPNQDSLVASKKTKKSCSFQAQVPYAKNLKSLKLSKEEQQKLKTLWGSLYAGYITRSAATDKVAQDWNALKANSFINNPFCKYTPLQQDPAVIHSLDVCLDRPNKDFATNIENCQTNFDNAYAALTFDYWTLIENYVNPDYFHHSFKTGNQWKKNYATFHVYKAVQRLNAICSISPHNLHPQVHCHGDVRDKGVIVNLQNNTHTPFLVMQSSLDGQERREIGFVEHGLNPLNLHTAALQQGSKGSDKVVSAYRFEFYELDPMNNQSISKEPLFSVGMYSGKQIVELLQTLPHDKPDIFEMNGRPTSAVHIANPDEWYMLLTQRLTPKDAEKRNPDQRIQAINLSKLDGPYLLTMQLNEQTFQHEDPHTKQAESVHIFQPSIVTAQVIRPPAEGQQALPLPILPQFLWELPHLQMYWMLLVTTYIAAATDFKFFGPGTFGSAFEYFNHLGYFDTKSEYRFIVEKYNLLQLGSKLSDVEWMVACALYESSMNTCNDIPSVYATQNNEGNFVVNGDDAFYINFQIAFTPKNLQRPDLSFFDKNGFNNAYNKPYHTMYTIIESIHKDQLSSMVFIYVDKIAKQIYKITIRDKHDIILNSQIIYLGDDDAIAQVSFLNKYSNWHSVEIVQSLNMNLLDKNSFALKYLLKEDKHLLHVSDISPIDKMDEIHIIELSHGFINELYYDFFHTFKVFPYLRYNIITQGVLPKFLQNLTEDDWKDGIYLIPSLKNKGIKNSSLSVDFYRYDKTLLGSINKLGTTVGGAMSNIQLPLKAYNLYGSTFNPLFEISLNVGMMLKYNKTRKPV